MNAAFKTTVLEPKTIDLGSKLIKTEPELSGLTSKLIVLKPKLTVSGSETIEIKTGTISLSLVTSNSFTTTAVKAKKQSWGSAFLLAQVSCLFLIC